MSDIRHPDDLRAYVSGALQHGASEEVEAHLRTCADCTAEVVALRALLASEPEPLTELERTRLRRGVMTAVAGDAGRPEPRRLGARIYQALAAAAVVAFLGGIAYLGLSGGGVDEAGVPETAADAGGDGGEATGGGAEVETLEAPAGPLFDRSVDELTRDQVLRLARRNPAFVAAALQYTAEDLAPPAEIRDVEGDSTASATQNSMAARAGLIQVDALAAQAPANVRDQVRECAASVTREQPTAVPVYGAVVRYESFDGGRALLLGFVWTNDGSGPLDQYMIWAWPLGTCETPVEYLFGPIGDR